MAIRKKQLRILIADDEVEFASTLAMRLQFREFSVRVVNSGQEALKAVKDEEPDVLLLDLKMPDLDGQEVLTHLREDFPDLRVIILTGLSSHDFDRERIELGVCDYIMKPVDLDKLITIIEDIAGEK